MLKLVSLYKVIEYCIAKEKDRNGESHFHCYLMFESKHRLSVLQEKLRPHFVYLDVQSVKSSRNVLKYITKEDNESHFNVKITRLSQYIQDYYWARDTDEFRFDDPYVSRDWRRYRFLEAYHRDFKSNRVSKGVLRPVEVSFQNWHLSVSTWWNDRVSKGYIRRGKCLFLYGKTGTGKSSCVEGLLGTLPFIHVYQPVGGRFFCSGLGGRHNVVLFEEFCCEEFRYQFPKLKRLMEGAPFSVDVKGCSSRTVIFKGVVIFVSNEYPELFDDALKDRCLFVEATEAFWLSKKILIPPVKEEILQEDLSEVEVIDLTSEESISSS